MIELEEAILQWSGKKVSAHVEVIDSRQWTYTAKDDGRITIKLLNMLNLLLEHTCQRSHTSY